jgi:hypothetical protein
MTVNIELERTQTTVAYLRYYPEIYLEELRKPCKPSVRRIDVPAEIRNSHLPKALSPGDVHAVSDRS